MRGVQDYTDEDENDKAKRGHGLVYLEKFQFGKHFTLYIVMQTKGDGTAKFQTKVSATPLPLDGILVGLTFEVSRAA